MASLPRSRQCTLELRPKGVGTTAHESREPLAWLPGDMPDAVDDAHLDPALLDPAALVERLSDGIVVSDDSGRIRMLNGAAERLLGWSREDLVGRPLQAIVPERLRRAHAEGFERYLTTREPRLIGRGGVRVPVVRRDGTEAEIELTLGVLAGADGRELFVGSLRDLSEQVQLERELKLARYLRATAEVTAQLGLRGTEGGLPGVAPELLGALGEALGWDFGALWTVDPMRNVLTCVDVWTAAGLVVDEFAAVTRSLVLRPGQGLPGRVWTLGTPYFVSDVVADPNFPRFRQANAAGLRSAYAFPVRGQHEVLGVVELFARVVDRPDPDLMLAMSTAGTQIGQFIERQRAERAALKRLEFLVRAGERLEASLDLDEAATAILDVAVPFVADYAALDIHASDGTRHCVVGTPDGAGGVTILRTVTPGEPPRRGSRDDSTPRLYARLDAEGWDAASRRDQVLVALREHDVDQMVVVPLPTHGRLAGTLALAFRAGRRPLGAEEIAFAEDLGRRASLALDNAQLFSEQRYIARSLQNSLLPAALPEVAGVELGVRYLAAAAGTDVGGDFYDVVTSGPDAWTFVIGDVCGKGVEAAAAAGLVRHTVRALSLRGERPGRVAEDLNDALLREESAAARFCTVVIGTLRPDSAGAAVTLACAGHPLPLVLRADGTRDYVGEPGDLLGVFTGARAPEFALRLEPGDALVLYTDGVTERRRGDEFLGEQGLAEVAGSLAGRTADEVADGIAVAVATFQAEGPRDDMAVLVLRVSPR